MDYIFVKLYSGQMIIGKEDMLGQCIFAPAEVVGMPTQTGYQFGIHNSSNL